ncbi:hypothetical protein [Pantoea endophytica]|uniref:hypothetical protein n=1 Tax=Pantoea endophytica TaxID=92488 RepID=UPI003016A111
MQRSKPERLVDAVLGDAVIAMLDGDDDISTVRLVGVLKSMAQTEQNAERREAVMMAIQEVEATLPRLSNTRDAAIQAFNAEPSPDSGRKH